MAARAEVLVEQAVVAVHRLLSLGRRPDGAIERGVERTSVTMTMLGGLAALLALFGAWMIGRTVTRPLAAITRVTEQVAEGDTVAIPYGSRSDEIGALSRSITVFQQAMCRNVDLNRSVIEASERPSCSSTPRRVASESAANEASRRAVLY